MYRLIFYCFFFGIYKTTLGLDEKCARNAECITTNALCIDGACTCDSLSYYNGTQCLQYTIEYMGICYENDQCAWLGENSECRHSRCVCSEHFRWYKGGCRKYADKGETCSSSDDCYNGYDLLSLDCTGGICQCKTGYYDRGGDCRRISAVSDDCALNLDCRNSLMECVLGKCSTQTDTFSGYIDVGELKSVPSEDILTFEEGTISCQIDNDCIDMANSLCDISNNKCSCNTETHFLYEGNCMKGLSHCDDETDCTGDNTMCFKNSSCVCQQGFFLRNKACMAELGVVDSNVKYKSDSDCPIKPGKLVDSACYCKNYWFTDELNQNCIKTMIESSRSCLTNEWCSAMGPFSFCNSTSSVCQCSSNAKFNEDTYYCELVSNDTDVDCLRDSDCSLNERCVDETCDCVENFSRSENDICLPNIGASCVINSCSHIDNSDCIGGVCLCENNYIGKESKCLKIADSLDAPCEEQEQCQNLNHAICGEAKTDYANIYSNNTLRCVCAEDYMQVEEVCFQIKKYGDPCMKESECTSVLNRSYKCRNSQCQCNVGQTPKNGYCTSSANMVLASFSVWLVVLMRVVLK